MAVKAKCFVTTSEEERGAYGIRIDNDEGVWFPRGVADALELEEFDEVEAILVRNDRPEPVWKAIRVRVIAEDER
jgi:hypothetical protein